MSPYLSFSSLQVRAAKSRDVPAVHKLIESLHLHESMLDDLKIYNEARRDAVSGIIWNLHEIDEFILDLVTSVMYYIGKFEVNIRRYVQREGGTFLLEKLKMML